MSRTRTLVLAAAVAFLVAFFALGFGASSTSEDTPEPFTPQTIAPAVTYQDGAP